MDFLFYAGLTLICAFIGASGLSHGRIGLWSSLCVGSIMMFGWATVLTSAPLSQLYG